MVSYFSKFRLLQDGNLVCPHCEKKVKKNDIKSQPRELKNNPIAFDEKCCPYCNQEIKLVTEVGFLGRIIQVSIIILSFSYVLFWENTNPVVFFFLCMLLFFLPPRKLILKK